MTANENPKWTARREFIKDVAAIGGAAALLTAGGKALANAVAPESEPQKPQSQGYRLTEHIKAYYRSAR